MRICIVVPDANEVRGSVKSSEPQLSPVMHPAMHNLLAGLSRQAEVEVEVIYGREHPKIGEDRWEGSVHYVPISYRTIPLPGIGGGYVGRMFALLRHIRATNPDLVHAQGTEREAGMVAALCRRPTLLTLHGNFRALAVMTSPRPWSYTWINAKLESWILPRVSGVLCISRYTQELVQPLNPNTWLLANPTNEELLQVQHRPDPGRIVFLGVIDERKNPILLIQAAKQLKEKGHDIELQLWGNLPEGKTYSDEFQSACDGLEWIHYCGSASPADIPQILAEAAILVLPSLEDNCPMVVIEALSCGVPVVASNVGGIPDLIDNGKNGFLFESQDLSSLCQALERLLTNADLYQAFSRNARETALKKFSPRAVADSHIDIYREIIDLHSI